MATRQDRKKAAGAAPTSRSKTKRRRRALLQRPAAHQLWTVDAAHAVAVLALEYRGGATAAG